MRKTKIVCTMGPACDDPAIFREMCRAGLNVARLNFSHNTHADHLRRIGMVKSVREELGLPIAIMLDTKGPEYRTGTFAGGRVTLREGDSFTFTTRSTVGDASHVGVNYPGLVNELAPGDTVLVNNGLVAFCVEEIKGEDILCRVTVGGELSDRKSMSFPGKTLHRPYLSDQDKEDLLFGIQNGVDFVAASFVSCREDLESLRAFMNENGGAGIDIIAKIENQAGIDNIEDICRACEGIMVARGDLGVEIPYAELPAVQKHLITKCRLLGRRVITATEMLESMIHNPRPTRAEISDVANAVYDGTSAVMLSGESAVGKYPVQTVHIMSEIVEETERRIDYDRRFAENRDFRIRNRADAISHAACGMAVDTGAKAIAVTSLSGMTVRMVSRFRAAADILGLAVNKSAWYKLALSWGVLPVLSEKADSAQALYENARRAAKEYLHLAPGDSVVVTTGDINGHSGNTDTIHLMEI